MHQITMKYSYTNFFGIQQFILIIIDDIKRNPFTPIYSYLLISSILLKPFHRTNIKQQFKINLLVTYYNY